MLVALGGGTTLQVIPGCAQLFGQAGASSLDFCFLLDCQTGFFGGLFQPCPQAVGGAPTAPSIFQDCPNLTAPFGTGLGTAGGGGQAGQGQGNQNVTINRGGFGPVTQPPAANPGNPGAGAGAGNAT